MEDKPQHKINQFTGNRAKPTTSELKVTVNTNSLTVSYSPKNQHALFDLCDFSGNIICKGKLEDITSIIDTAGLKNGSYSLWVVDGEDLLKYNFTINR